MTIREEVMANAKLSDYEWWKKTRGEEIKHFMVTNDRKPEDHYKYMLCKSDVPFFEQFFKEEGLNVISWEEAENGQHEKTRIAVKLSYN